MTSRQHGFIHAPRGRLLHLTADDTARTCVGTLFRQLTTPHPSEHVISSSTGGSSVLRASQRLSGFKLVSTRCTIEFWVSVRLYSSCRQSQSMFSTSCQSQSMYLTCRFRSRRAADSNSLCDPKRQPRPSSGYVATCFLCKGSCISL